MLDGVELRITFRVEVAVAIGMNDAVDKVGVVERRRRLVVRRLRKLTRRRPLLPQQLAERATILRKAGPSAFGVEVPLIPKRRFDLWRRWTRSREDVLNRIARDEDAGAHAVRMKRRGDLGGAAAPVVTTDRKLRELQRIGEVDHILSDGGLFGHARRLRIAEVRRAVAAQIGHEHPVSRLRQRRRHFVVRVHIVRKSVEEDDGKAAWIAALDVADVEDGCLYQSFGGCLSETGRHRHAGDLQKVASRDHFNSLRTTCPPFITNFTRSISVTSFSGSPLTAMTSAYLPFSRLPTRSAQ